MDTRKDRLSQEIDWLLRDKYGGKHTSALERDIVRLRKGEHINYLIGWTPFFGCRIDLSTRPLIPRPETEHWTEKAIEMIRASGIARPRVLDLFCGSGCIGVAILKHVPQSGVDFVDIEPRHFGGIRKSLRLNRINRRRAHCIRSDVFKNLGARKYDFILANPPYIPTSGRRVSKTVLDQEPRRALFGGKDGLKYIRELLREGRKHLLPKGIMIVEFDPRQKTAIRTYACSKGWESVFLKDQYGRWRFGSFA